MLRKNPPATPFSKGLQGPAVKLLALRPALTPSLYWKHREAYFSHRRHSASSSTWGTITGSVREVLWYPKMVQVHRPDRGEKIERTWGHQSKGSLHQYSRSSGRAGSNLRPDARLGIGSELALHPTEPTLLQATVGHPAMCSSSAQHREDRGPWN